MPRRSTALLLFLGIALVAAALWGVLHDASPISPTNPSVSERVPRPVADAPPPRRQDSLRAAANAKKPADPGLPLEPLTTTRPFTNVPRITDETRPADPMALSPREAEAAAIDLDDLSKFTKDEYWNPTHLSLTAAESAELRSILEPLKKAYDSEVAEQIRQVKEVAGELAKKGELETRMAGSPGPGAYRHLLTTISGLSVDIPISSKHIPEVADVTMRVNGKAADLKSAIQLFFRTKPREWR